MMATHDAESTLTSRAPHGHPVATSRMSELDGDDELIERYLRNDLDFSARDAFEVRLLEDRALLERVELTARLREGLRANAAELRRRSHGSSNWLSALRDSFFAPPFAAAVACFLALGTAFLAWRAQVQISTERGAQVALRSERDALVDELATLRAPGLPPAYAIPVLRSAGTDPDLVIRADPKVPYVALIVPLPEPLHAAYDLKLSGADGTVVFQGLGTQPNLGNQALILIRGSSLRPGDYRLAAVSSDDAAIRWTYLVRVK